MRRAVILHGTDGSPTELVWQGWLRDQLEAVGYDVLFPQLPNSHTPDLAAYDEFLRDQDWDFTDNILIGHSSGATTALYLLQQSWFPHVKATILVGTFLNECLVTRASWYEPGQFDKLFVASVDPLIIQRKSDLFYFVHGDDDPHCDYDEAKMLCKKLNGKFLTMHGAGHIAKSSSVTELPELVNVLRRDHLLS